MKARPTPHETLMDPYSYLGALVLDPERKISRIYSTDGAALYRITPEHYVCIQCSDEEHHHQGKALLERVLPPEWECFYAAANTLERFEAYHYGPQ